MEDYRVTLIGRLAKWMMILSKFYIQYVEQKSIKGQAIANQLAKFPIIDDAILHIDFLDATYINKKSQKMFFNDFHMQNGVGDTILFVTPYGYTIPKSYKLLYPCTNNIVEYEALLNGVKLAPEW